MLFFFGCGRMLQTMFFLAQFVCKDFFCSGAMRKTLFCFFLSWYFLSANATAVLGLLYVFLFLRAHPPNINKWTKDRCPRNFFSALASLSFLKRIDPSKTTTISNSKRLAPACADNRFALAKWHNAFFYSVMRVGHFFQSPDFRSIFFDISIFCRLKMGKHVFDMRWTVSNCWLQTPGVASVREKNVWERTGGWPKKNRTRGGTWKSIKIDGNQISFDEGEKKLLHTNFI